MTQQSPADQKFVVGVDGGNSKTDVVLANDRGVIRSHVHGAGTTPDKVGMSATTHALADLVRRAVREAGLAADTPVAVGTFYLANFDVPEDEDAVRAELISLGIAERVEVRNDVFAVLRAGSKRGWGVAVVSGAGINAVGVHPDGREERFLALGDVTGDWGGGYAVGMAGLGAAVRAEDGRGAATVLSERVAKHVGQPDAQSAAVWIHREPHPEKSVLALAPVVFRAATDGDVVAREIVERLADEAVNMAVTLLRRLDLLRSDADVVLGGGTMQAGHAILLARITARLTEAASNVDVRVLDVVPVAGALASALELVGASAEAQAAARESLVRRDSAQ